MRGLPHLPYTRHDLDIGDKQAVAAALKQFRPWAVVNAAGYVRVDDAECEPDHCYAVNSEAPAVLAEVCAEQEIQLLTFSSDLVFDGHQTTPYVESDPVAPLNVYGRSKAAAEQRVLELYPAALVIRTSAFFGPWDQYNFVSNALQTVAQNQPFVAASDATISPTYVPDLIQTCLDLLIDRESGIWHLANQGTTTWAELAQTVAYLAGYDPRCVESRPTQALKLAAARPSYSVLGSERALLLPSLANALERYLVEVNRLKRPRNTATPL
jgi:dTDP-4-dehydrorhamnose reductase